jgi:hypothetical protein
MTQAVQCPGHCSELGLLPECAKWDPSTQGPAAKPADSTGKHIAFCDWQLSCTETAAG